MYDMKNNTAERPRPRRSGSKRLSFGLKREIFQEHKTARKRKKYKNTTFILLANERNDSRKVRE